MKEKPQAETNPYSGGSDKYRRVLYSVIFTTTESGISNVGNFGR